MKVLNVAFTRWPLTGAPKLKSVETVWCHRTCARPHALFTVPLLVILGVLAAPAVSDGQYRLVDFLRTKPKIQQIPGAAGVTLNEYRMEDPVAPRHGTTVCLIRIPGDQADLRVRTVAKSGDKAGLFESLAEASDIIVVNGGFFGFDARNNKIPLGLVISQGKTQNKLHPWKTGGILLRARHVQIVPVAQFRFSRDIAHAIQSKPILVRDAKNDIFKEDRELFDRVAVGLTSEGDLIVAGVFGPGGKGAALYEFGEFLSAPTSRGGPGLTIALAMDGGPGAHIYLPRLRLHFGLSGSIFVPNTIHIGQRR